MRWVISREDERVDATGIGKIGCSDLIDFFAALSARGARRHPMSFDLTLGELVLSRDDLSKVAGVLADAGRKGRRGPVAMIVRTERALDMAVLLKQRVPNDGFRIFTDSGAAEAWLSGFGAGNGRYPIIRRWLPRAARQPGVGKRTHGEQPLRRRRSAR
ncbi:MAG: hypothetical protein ACOY4R_06720 [Pseudomonadota bacterium]